MNVDKDITELKFITSEPEFDEIKKVENSKEVKIT